MTHPSAPQSSAPPSSQMGLALRFISGKYQGGEFPLAEGQEMVSRRHARISVKRGAIVIEDLGSTNGTFVNGEKIEQASLREGDRVLIGTSILKVIPVVAAAPADQDLEAVAARHETQRQAAGRSEDAALMTGSLEEIPLPDLLQLLGTSRKSGVLVLQTASAVGRIFMEGGTIRSAAIEGAENLVPVNAVYRMLGWNQGKFQLEPPRQMTFEQQVELSVQEVLMEGFRLQDEFAQLRNRLPPMKSRIILRTPLEAPLHELEPAHLDVLQQSLNSPNLGAVFERSRNTDLDTARILLSLIDRGYLTAVGG
jgi:hypothetical protein